MDGHTVSMHSVASRAWTSQCFCLIEHLIAERGMKAGFGHDIDSAPKEVLDIHQQPAECEPRSLGRQRNQQVDVACVVRIAPGYRPEYPNVTHSVAFGEGQDLGAVLFDQGVHLTRASKPIGAR